MIEEAWKDYEAKVIPPTASVVQRTECRRAFWAGATTCFFGVLRRLDEGQEPTEADLKFMDGVKAEFDAYKAECVKEAERFRSIDLRSHRPDLGPLDKTCNRKDCGKPTRWQVALVFFAAGHTQAHQGMTAETALALCDDHGKTMTAEDFLTDEGFAKVCHAMRAIGKAEPQRSLTRVKLLPILMGRG
jgi:hypothetical protein